MENKTQNNPAVNSIKGKGTLKASNIFKKQEFLLVILMILIGIMVAIVNPLFLSLQNFFNIVLSVSITGIATIGLAMVLITGEFDLTTGSLMSVQCVLFAILTTKFGAATGIILTLLIGLALGAFNGLLVTRIKAHSFIITLALLSAYAGVALVLSNGEWVSMKGTFTLFKGKLFGIIPYPTIVFIVVLVITAFVFRYLRFGRLLFAIGGNVQAAYLSGIKVKNYKILVFTIAGFLYSIASIVLVSMLGTALPTTGDPYLLEAFAAAVVGGVVMGGGKGSAAGIFLGVIVFGLINNALVIMNVDPFWRDVVVGGIILAAVAISGYGESKE